MERIKDRYPDCHPALRDLTWGQYCDLIFDPPHIGRYLTDHARRRYWWEFWKPIVIDDGYKKHHA